MSCSVDVALHRGQVDDVLAEEVVRHLDAVREDAMKHVHLRLGPVLDPLHVLLFRCGTSPWAGGRCSCRRSSPAPGCRPGRCDEARASSPWAGTRPTSCPAL